jgi:TspO/MBR family
MIDFPIQTLEGLLGWFIGLALVINGVIFWLGFYRKGGRGLPPGSIIGSIWVFLIGCMAYAQWLILQSCDYRWVHWLIPGLFTFCILYPLYTAGFSSKKISDISTVLSFALSGYIAYILYSYNWLAAGLIGLTTLWTLYVSYITIF